MLDISNTSTKHHEKFALVKMDALSSVGLSLSLTETGPSISFKPQKNTKNIESLSEIRIIWQWLTVPILLRRRVFLCFRKPLVALAGKSFNNPFGQWTRMPPHLVGATFGSWHTISGMWVASSVTGCLIFVVEIDESGRLKMCFKVHFQFQRGISDVRRLCASITETEYTLTRQFSKAGSLGWPWT